MKSGPNVVVLLPALALMLSADVQAQTTDPPYLSQMPTVERVKAEIEGTDPMDTAARQAGAFWRFRMMIRDLAYAQGRGDRQHTPDEQRLANEYYAGHHYVYQPVLDALSDADKRKYHNLHSGYAYGTEFLDELLQRLFPPEFRIAYYQAMGTQPPATQPMSAQPSVADDLPQPSEPAATSEYAYLAEGDSYLEAEDYARAIEAYQRAINLSPTFWSAHQSLGAAYFNLEQYDKAIPAFLECLRLEPNDGNTLVWLAEAYYRLEQYPEAVAALQQAVRLEPNNATYRLHLGYAYLDMGWKEEALQVHKELLTLDEEKARVLYEDIRYLYP
ncbi:MAG: tetratricopeptide repeat protein [Ardenticatenaceae bacterium]